VSVGGAAEFNASHVMQVLMAQNGLDTNYVATGEGATAVVAGVRGGHFPVGLTSIQQYIGAEDTIKPLAVFSREPFPQAPDVPTMDSLGYEIVGATNWGLAGPAGMDPAQIQTIWEAIEKAYDNPDVQANFEENGQAMIGLGPEEAEEYVAERLADVESVVPIFKEMEGS